MSMVYVSYKADGIGKSAGAMSSFRSLIVFFSCTLQIDFTLVVSMSMVYLAIKVTV